MPIEHGRRILLVEDDTIVALAERQVLEAAGYAVTVVHSGEQAVERAATDPRPDLVLMDIDLGAGIDGTEAARQILQASNLPVVFLSSHTEPDIVARTGEITSYGYIVKNSGATILLASVRMAFQLWRAHRDLQRANDENERQRSYQRTILETAPVGFLVVNTDGYIEDVNDAYCEFTGFTRQALVGQHISERDRDETPEDTQRRIAELSCEGRQSFTANHLRGDGTTIPLRFNARLTDTSKGRKFVAFCRDVSPERLQANLFEQVPGAIYQYRYYPDGHSNFPMASRNIWFVYEVTPEEVETDATPVFRRLHPEDYDGVVESIMQSRDSLSEWAYEYRVILPSRGERWLRGTAKPELLEDGSVLWHGYITDITEYKIAYRALEEQSRRYESVISGTNAGTWEWNVQTGQTIFNERWAQMIGYTLKELQPTTIDTWMRYTHPDDLKASDEALKKHFASETEFYEVEARMRHRNGHWVRVLDRGKVFTWTESGEPEWMFGTHQDITERARSEEKYEKMTNSSPAIIVLTDDETGGFVEVNDAFVNTFGYAREEIIGRLPIDAVGLDPNVNARAWEELDRAGSFAGVETCLTAKDGSAVDVLMYGARITVQERSLNLVTAMDIRRLKQTEAALGQALRAKQTLMNELNHRVKNNLAMVASLIRLKKGEAGANVDLSDLESRVQTIASMYEELQHAAELDRVDLQSYLQRIAEGAFRGTEQAVTVSVRVGEQQAPTKIATSLGLIVNELALNAIKHGYPGTDAPEFSVERAPGTNGQETILVSNNGHPVPPDICVDSPTTMGLQLVAALTSQIGGTVALERTPQTMFRIEYPRPI